MDAVGILTTLIVDTHSCSFSDERRRHLVNEPDTRLGVRAQVTYRLTRYFTEISQLTSRLVTRVPSSAPPARNAPPAARQPETGGTVSSFTEQFHTHDTFGRRPTTLAHFIRNHGHLEAVCFSSSSEDSFPSCQMSDLTASPESGTSDSGTTRRLLRFVEAST